MPLQQCGARTESEKKKKRKKKKEEEEEEKKHFSRRSCWDCNPQVFNRESGDLPELSRPMMVLDHRSTKVKKD